MYNNALVSRTTAPKDYAYSVRCLNHDIVVNQPPGEPTNPDPSNGSIEISINTTLKWSCFDPNNDPIIYDIYFGTNPDPSILNQGLTDTLYDPGLLVYSTTYYWKVLAYDQSDTTESPVWSFTTEFDPNWQCGDSLNDIRDGQKYETVAIGSQCWLSENLNIGIRISGSENQSDNDTIEKYCYNNEEDSCIVYGGLYQWDEMMQYENSSGIKGICPPGWHLPTDEDWCVLENQVDQGTVSCTSTGWRGTDAGGNLKEIGTSHWNTPNTGATNSSGFTALGGGDHDAGGTFVDIKTHAHLWTSTEDGSNALKRLIMFDKAQVNRTTAPKNYAYSVRCVNDVLINNQPPDQPNIISPIDNRVNQLLNTNLNWYCSDPDGDQLLFDVYFGINPNPGLYFANILDTILDLGALAEETQFYWKVVAHDQLTSTEGPVWTFTTQSDGIPCPDLSSITYEGKVYNTVQIGDQCWLKENLDIGTQIDGSADMQDNLIIEKYCYDNDPSNCDSYGGLYQWNEAMQYLTDEGVQGICPPDWHLPTNAEWDTLAEYFDTTPFDQGFSSVFGGWKDSNDNFEGNSGLDFLWSSTWAFSGISNEAYFRFRLNSENVVDESYTQFSLGMSIRCLRDEIINQPPEVPINVSPLDNKVNQFLNTSLKWSCSDPEGNPLTYDVYFGTDANPPLHSAGISDTLLDLGILLEETQFYWKITAYDDNDNFTEGSIWTFTTQSEGIPCPGLPTITYGSKVYNTIQIQNQCWLKENLDIGLQIDGSVDMQDNSVIEKYCYDNDPVNCIDYGGLYQWNEVMQYSIDEGVQGICPPDWHLPTNAEWDTLAEYFNTIPYDQGFSSVFGGWRWGANSFNSINIGDYLWTSKIWISPAHGQAYFRDRMIINNVLYGSYTHTPWALSIRCIKD